MSCVKPYIIQLKNNEIAKTDCGRCMQCRIKKQSELKFLAERELLNYYQNGQGASFVTLTYNDDNIPFVHLPTGNYYRGLLNMCSTRNEVYFTLCRKDISDFLKRVRRNMDYHKCKIDFKVLYCGEFGGQTDRPHAHIIFLGLSDVLAKTFTSKCWKFGLCDVGPLSAGGIDYVTKYYLKSETYDPRIKALFHHCKVETPFVYHSVNLGKKWLFENAEKLSDKHFSFYCRGKQQLLPKYVRDFISNYSASYPSKVIPELANFHSLIIVLLRKSFTSFVGSVAE